MMPHEQQWLVQDVSRFALDDVTVTAWLRVYLVHQILLCELELRYVASMVESSCNRMLVEISCNGGCWLQNDLHGEAS